MDLSRYAALPDAMPLADVWQCISDILDLAESGDCTDEREVAEALNEMADRQWHTYERLEVGLRGRIDAWIERVWDSSDHELVELIVGIVGRIGLPRSLELLKSSLAVKMEPETRRYVEEAIDEFGETVDDPYAGMR